MRNAQGRAMAFPGMVHRASLGPTKVNRVALAANTTWVRNDSQIGHATEFPSIGCQ